MGLQPIDWDYFSTAYLAVATVCVVVVAFVGAYILSEREDR